MVVLAVVLLAIWVTLAFTKLHALVFVLIVMAVGLAARQVTRLAAARRPKPSLLRQAISEQLTPDALTKRRMMIGTYGSAAVAPAAFQVAKQEGAALVVCFIRQVALSYKYEGGKKPDIDTDLAAQRTFARFLDIGHSAGVPVIPVYDTGPDAAELMAEAAAIYGVERVLIGTSRKGALYHLIKGYFQQSLEALLPPDVPVQVMAPDAAAEADAVGAHPIR
jgi:hypothetical protein